MERIGASGAQFKDRAVTPDGLGPLSDAVLSTR
jgi:hypothetical protein